MSEIKYDVSGILSDQRPTRNLLEILYPLTAYYAAVMMIMVVLRAFLGLTDSNYVVIQLMISVLVIPVVYFAFYRMDRRRFATPVFFDYIRHPKEFFGNLIIIIFMAIFMGAGLNNLIAMTPLPELSQGYRQASDHFYGSTPGLEILSSGVVTPVLEELLYRGVIYGRMRQMPHRNQSKWLAIIISAFVFGLMHFNTVQFLYAFVLGVVLALVMEWTGHVCWPMAIHMATNIFAVLRTEFGFMDRTTDKSLSAWILSVLFIAVGVGLLVLLARKNKWKFRKNR